MKTALTDLRPVREYLNRIGAHISSIRSATIREREGCYYRDISRIRITPEGEVRLSGRTAGLEPTEAEKAAITAEVAQAEILSLAPPYDLDSFPDKDGKELFEFRATEGEGAGRILMVQERMETPEGKVYVPWTLWEDGEWRRLEPEGLLPLYNADSLHENSVVFIHEGPKTVRDLLRMLQDGGHAWQDELEGAAHVGWIGGALNPYRTDWGILARLGVTMAYIVADNDKPGREAVRGVSRALGCVTRWIRFPDDFPVGFDLGDRLEDRRWPPFRTTVNPATWLTHRLPKEEGAKGPAPAVLRDHAKSEWIYIEEGHIYIHVAEPNRLISADQFNTIVRPYSDVDNTRRVVDAVRSDRSVRIAYLPGEEPGHVHADGTAFNTHVGSYIRPIPGDAGLFLEYMEGIIPDEDERDFVMDWVATLLAYPGMRMSVALLMIGGFGIGKTTLGQDILAPLLGEHNVTYPGEKDILGDYNEWVAHKRLAVVNEIQAGRGEKIYEQLKTVVTDKKITVNRKYFRQYETDCWCHIYACSNHEDALAIKPKDRRWYMPRIRATEWADLEWWQGLHRWLGEDGLGIILAWALERAKERWIPTGMHAPMTELKAEIIGLTENEELKRARTIAHSMHMIEGPASIDLMTVKGWLRRGARGTYMPNDNDIIKVMREQGLEIMSNDARIKASGSYQRTLGNRRLVERLEQGLEGSERRKAVRECRIDDIGRLFSDEEAI